MMNRFLSSISEPKSVTAVIVTVYVAIAVTGATFIVHVTSLTWIIIVAGVLMVVSGVLGAPSAWLGSWWLEGPSALMAVAGMMLIAVNELMLMAPHVRWPLHMVVLSVIIALLFLARALLVWPYSYRPGVLPKSKLEEAKEQYNKTRQEYISTIHE